MGIVSVPAVLRSRSDAPLDVLDGKFGNDVLVGIDIVEGIDKSSSPVGGPGSGFLPSFKAFLISAAFHTEYFCFCSRSGGSSPNWLRISKKMLAA